MDYETYLLNDLLDKYERSSLFRTGQSNRRILFKPSEDQELQKCFSDGQQKQFFIEMVTKLKTQGVIDFEWVMFEEGNLLQEIWLTTTQEMIKLAYKKIQRVPKEAFQAQLMDRMRSELANFKILEHKLLVESLLQEAEEKQRGWNPPFDFSGLEDVLATLKYLENRDGVVVDKRILSINVYNDSKYFETKVQGKLLSLFAKYVFEWTSDELTVMDKLFALGIGKSPEKLYFSGPVRCYFSEDFILDTSWYKDGFILNASYLDKLLKVSGDYKKIMMIENLANYYWFLRKQADVVNDGYLIFYTAGFLSKNQIKFLNSIDKSKVTEIFHWGDIDVGGMRIYKQVQSVIPGCQPHKMDAHTFNNYPDLRKKVTREYIANAERMLLDDSFEVFNEVLELITESGEILEQEAELYY